MRGIYGWFTAKASRTWIAHGLICLGPSTAFALGMAQFGGYDGHFWQAVASSCIGFLFGIKELKDRHVHQAEGEWNKPQWKDRVTFATDMAGDLLGPCFVALTLWTALWVDRIGW